MDVHCCNCGEPWDQYFLRHELAEEALETLAPQGWEFGPNRLVVLRCPACSEHGSALPDTDQRKEIVRELASLLGDDEDGLASTLEDFDL